MKQEVMEKLDHLGSKLKKQANTANKPVVAGSRASLNAYARLSTDGLTQLNNKTACYGSLGGYLSGRKGDIILNWVSVGNAMENWNCWHGDDLYTFTKNEMIRYSSYLARRSPYASAFLDKHCGNMVDKEFAIMTADLPGNLVVGAMTAHRQLWEYTRLPKTWLRLRKAQPHGNEDWHFLLANIIHVKEDGTFSFHALSGGHVPLAGGIFTMENVKNFINHKLTGLRSKPFYKDKGYHGVQDLFHSDKDSPSLLSSLRFKVRYPNGQLNLNDTLFAWNTRFSGVEHDAIQSFSLQEHLPVIEEFYQQNFGGNK